MKNWNAPYRLFKVGAMERIYWTTRSGKRLRERTPCLLNFTGRREHTLSEFPQNAIIMRMWFIDGRSGRGLQGSEERERCNATQMELIIRPATVGYVGWPLWWQERPTCLWGFKAEIPSVQMTLPHDPLSQHKRARAGLAGWGSIDFCLHTIQELWGQAAGWYGLWDLWTWFWEANENILAGRKYIDLEPLHYIVRYLPFVLLLFDGKMKLYLVYSTGEKQLFNLKVDLENGENLFGVWVCYYRPVGWGCIKQAPFI